MFGAIPPPSYVFMVRTEQLDLLPENIISLSKLTLFSALSRKPLHTSICCFASAERLCKKVKFAQMEASLLRSDSH